MSRGDLYASRAPIEAMEGLCVVCAIAPIGVPTPPLLSTPAVSTTPLVSTRAVLTRAVSSPAVSTPAVTTPAVSTPRSTSSPSEPARITSSVKPPPSSSSSETTDDGAFANRPRPLVSQVRVATYGTSLTRLVRMSISRSPLFRSENANSYALFSSPNPSAAYSVMGIKITTSCTKFPRNLVSVMNGNK